MGTLWVKVKGELRKRYVGQWSENHPHGRGVYYYANGDQYSGEWKNGVRHGAGTLTTEKGVYEGAFFNNKKHGFGILDLPNGDHFEGMFVDDMKEGEGVHFYFDKERKTHTKRSVACHHLVFSVMQSGPCWGQSYAWMLSIDSVPNTNAVFMPVRIT